MQHFTTQLTRKQQTTHSLRAKQYRRHKEPSHDEEQDKSSPSPEPHRAKVPPGSSEVAQLRVAGLSSEDESSIPPAPFPHAPVRVAKTRYTASKLQEEVFKPPVRLYAATALSKGDSINKQGRTTSLRKTHIDVLSTVMHRCLLEGDYGRAGRAWGMLLRTHVAGGRPVDPRNNGRWGIGPEILLHRKSGAPITGSEQEPFGQDVFSVEGFELAKVYYEALINQHSYLSSSPHTVDSRTFYPAMFSLWIFQTCEASKRARKLLHEKVQQSRSRSLSVDSVLGDDSDNTRAREIAIEAEELARATEISQRLDGLFISPPFDKQAGLLQLRGHVGLWISSLIIGKNGEDEDWDMESVTREGEDHSNSAEERLARLTSCYRELQQAQNFLQRAEANGATRQAATMANLDIKFKELARLSVKLRALGEDDDLLPPLELSEI
jgi:hypothetical protein